jgi:ferredoxin
MEDANGEMRKTAAKPLGEPKVSAAGIDKLRIRIIREECLGDGACCDDAPGTFMLDGEGIATVRANSSDDRSTILNAARKCPTGSIVISDNASGEQLVP